MDDVTGVTIPGFISIDVQWTWKKSIHKRANKVWKTNQDPNKSLEQLFLPEAELQNVMTERLQIRNQRITMKESKNKQSLVGIAWICVKITAKYLQRLDRHLF